MTTSREEMGCILGEMVFEGEKYDNGCSSCEDAFDCFLESTKKIENPQRCHIQSGDYSSILCYNSSAKECGHRRYKFCQTVTQILFNRQEVCPTFAAPKGPKENAFKCVNCKEDLFKSCEIFEHMASEPAHDNEVARESVANALYEAKTEDGTCFGGFKFEKVCWEQCDTRHNCLRESGVGKFTNGKMECVLYNPKEKDISCDSCSFQKICSNTREGEITQVIEEEKRVLMFSRCFSLRELRRKFTEE